MVIRFAEKKDFETIKKLIKAHAKFEKAKFLDHAFKDSAFSTVGKATLAHFVQMRSVKLDVTDFSREK